MTRQEQGPDEETGIMPVCQVSRQLLASKSDVKLAQRLSATTAASPTPTSLLISCHSSTQALSDNRTGVGNLLRVAHTSWSFNHIFLAHLSRVKGWELEKVHGAPGCLWSFQLCSPSRFQLQQRAQSWKTFAGPALYTQWGYGPIQNGSLRRRRPW